MNESKQLQSFRLTLNDPRIFALTTVKENLDSPLSVLKVIAHESLHNFTQIVIRR